MEANDQAVWRNPVRARLEAGQPAFGLTITIPSVEAAAHAATLGFHFLWVEMEHSPITLETLRLGAAVRTWPMPGSYYDSADAQVMTVCVVEEASALDEIDAIAGTEGVEAIFIGTSDLSFSLGLRGRQDEPALQEAIARIAAAARRHGKFLGRPAGTPEQVRRYMDEGFLLFQLPTEIGLMELGARQLLEPLGISGLPTGRRALY